MNVNLCVDERGEVQLAVVHCAGDAQLVRVAEDLLGVTPAARKRARA